VSMEGDPRLEPEVPRAEPGALVGMALRFYGLLFLAAWLWRSAWLGEPLLHASAEAAERGVSLARDVTVGLLAAGVVIGLSHQLTRHTRSGRALARGLAGLLGPLEPRHVLVLALLSGVAEEAFFRGALQPRVGLVLASLIFGAVHFIPRREFRLWTLFSLAAGFLLGFLFEATGNLVAPVVTHMAVNAVNLTLLVRGGPWEEEG
jgi:membrane protease YdiL (CAAX protease family)